MNLATNLITAGGEPRVAFRKYTFHAQKECALDLEGVLLQGAAMLEQMLWAGQHRRHLVVVRRVDVLVDAVAGELDL